MTMKNIAQYFLIGALLILGSGFFPAHSVAKDTAAENTLLEGTVTVKQYLLQLSGMVMDERFSGARALLTLMPTEPGAANPYLLIIEGFPKQNSRNSFFWNSRYSEMSAISNEITCDIKRTFIKPVPMFFMHLSPELLRPPQGMAFLRPTDEVKRDAEKVALPTVINSRAGQLKLRIHSNSVSGTVWMKGYDPVEKAFVLYSAQLYGEKSHHLKPRWEQKKSTMVAGE